MSSNGAICRAGWCTRGASRRLGKLGGVAPALPTFAEVRVAEVAAPAPQPATPTPTPTPGLICIELPGGVRVSVDSSVDAGALARVLSVLG